MSALVELFAAAAALFAEPRPVTVPDALLATTSMPEPSGAVWSAALSRYLIISDDTGDKQRGTGHAPWLFTMSREGVMDSAPLPILGLEKLNDAEALCAGPEGSFLLSTSHSRNRKGRDKAERRMMLQLVLSGRALTIVGRLDLAEALTASGLLPPGSVDIEGLAFRDGALYVGLKAPQTPTGAALILRIPDLQSALRAGALPAAQVQRFAEVPLRVPGEAGEVVQGISDLTFLPDGSLALLANSPKGLPPDGGGALWWLRPGTAPSLVRRFPGLKPEGVTLTEDQKALLIVIDHDRQQPLWLRQPLPAPPKPPAPLPSPQLEKTRKK